MFSLVPTLSRLTSGETSLYMFTYFVAKMPMLLPSLLVQFHLPWYKIQIHVKCFKILVKSVSERMAKGPYQCWLWGIKALRDIWVVVHSCSAPGKSAVSWPLSSNMDYSLLLLILLQWWVTPLNTSKLKGL